VAVAGEQIYLGPLVRVTWHGAGDRSLSWYVATGDDWDDERMAGREGVVLFPMGGSERVRIHHRGALVPMR
jgi:hypothetical protein